MPKRENHNTGPIRIIELQPRKPGYSWIADKFGPSPGIPREEKEKLDDMSDHSYIKAVLKLVLQTLYSLMISEAERRRTFRSTWKFEHVVRGRDLARVGFYSLNSGDLVKCVFCEVEFDNWTKQMNPLVEHKKKSPYCEYVTGKALHNIPVDDTMSSSTSLKDSTLTPPSPKHLEYQNHSVRVSSFTDWSNQLTDLSQRFGDAGFFLNSDGTVVCHSCGHVLDMDWNGNEDPWELHAQWKPDCPFLIQNMGYSYINRVGGYPHAVTAGRQHGKFPYEFSYRV